MEDGLRHAYLSTRLALLERRVLDETVRVEALRQGHGGEAYVALRTQMLRERFAKRRALREVIGAASKGEEEAADPKSATSAATTAAAAQKRYRVAEEYSFAGMGHIFDHHKAAVTRVVWANGDPSLLALCCVDGSVSLVSSEGKIVQNFKRPSKKACVARDVAWSLTNEWLLIGYDNGVAALYVVQTAALLRYVKEETAVVSCAFHPHNPNHFLVVSQTTASIYNASTGLPVTRLQLGFNPAPLTCATFAGDWIFVGTEIGRLRAYQDYKFREEVQLPSRAPVRSLQYQMWVQQKQQVRTVLVSLQGTRKTLGLVRLTREDKLQATAVWFAVPSAVNAVRSCFCPLAPSSRDGACVVSGGDDMSVRIYDVMRAKNPLINCLQGHTAAVLDVAWNLDETLLASSDASGVVILWRRTQRIAAQ